MTRRFFPSRTPQRIPAQSVSLGVTLTPVSEPVEIPECAPAIVRDPEGNIVAELRCGEEYQYSCPPCETAEVTWWPENNPELGNPFSGTLFTELLEVSYDSIYTDFENYISITPPATVGYQTKTTDFEPPGNIPFYFILRTTGAQAEGASISESFVSGVSADSFSILGYNGEFALVQFLFSTTADFNVAPDEAVYTVTAYGADLTINMQFGQMFF